MLLRLFKETIWDLVLKTDRGSTPASFFSYQASVLSLLEYIFVVDTSLPENAYLLNYFLTVVIHLFNQTA